MSLAYQELTTERLRLRLPRTGDAPAIFESFGADARVTRYLAWRPHRSVADAEAALRARIARQEQGIESSWMIELSRSPGVAGVISAWLEPEAAELGFALAHRHWSQGVMTEAVVAVMDWGFGVARMTRLWATCDSENLASARVLEKAGFANSGPFDREIVRPNLSPMPRPSLLFEATRG